MKLNLVDRRQSKRSKYVPDSGIRTFPRYDAPVDCIYISNNQTFTTRFINLSLRGIYIDTKTPDTPGTKVRIRLILPNSEIPLDIEGEVIWATNNSMVSDSVIWMILQGENLPHICFQGPASRPFRESRINTLSG